VLFEEGDEVSFPLRTGFPIRIVILTGAKPVILKTTHPRIQIGPGQLEEAINPRTKAVIINSPPTHRCGPISGGTVELAEVLLR